MAGRPGLDPTEEGKSYSALFVLMVAVLLVSAVWSIWDDNISRRPWKQYQVEWDHLAYDKYMNDAADEQKRLNADPEYQKVSKDLAEAQKELDSGATAAKLADLRAQLVDLNNTANDKDQLVRFTKSYPDRAMVRLQSCGPGQGGSRRRYKAGNRQARRGTRAGKYRLRQGQGQSAGGQGSDRGAQLAGRHPHRADEELTAKRDDFFDKADS